MASKHTEAQTSIERQVYIDGGRRALREYRRELAAERQASDKGPARLVTYRCRDIGYGIEAGIKAVIWTDELDTWGKRTLLPLDGSPAIYLFPDEIVHWKPL